jgi:hypothetical protein
MPSSCPFSSPSTVKKITRPFITSFDDPTHPHVSVNLFANQPSYPKALLNYILNVKFPTECTVLGVDVMWDRDRDIPQ